MSFATRRSEFADLLHRHGAVLARMRGSRGVIPCLFHEDRHPSLSLDLDRAIFNCFACGARGGVLDLRRLLGEDRLRRPQTPAQQRLREHAGRRRAAEARWGDVLPLWRASDGVRHRRRAAASLRTLATRWRAEHPACWPALAAAARVETAAAQCEIALDATLVSERRVA